MVTRAEISIQSKQETRWVDDFVKRTFDMIVSFLVLVLFAPFYAFIAIAIKRDTPGPVFYRGLRLGRRGVYFKILKFRTMYETTASYAGPKVTAQDDARVTPLGRWLRDTKLNEFPQFWNVLKGDMSLVGPRPEDPSLAQTWPTHVARELMSVRPGITSPASVLYRNEENMLHANDVLQKYLHDLSPDKLRLDQLYVRYRSFWLDLDTIIWTALLLIPKIRAYSPPEPLLFVGPVTRFIKRYMSWFVRDVLVIFVSINIMSFVLGFFGPLDLSWWKSLEMALAFALLYNCTGAFMGANRISWSKASSWDIARLVTAWLITTGIAMTMHKYLHLATPFGITLILTSSILSLLGILLVRYRTRLATAVLGRLEAYQIASRATRERVLIVGSGRTAEHIAWLLGHRAYAKKFRVVGLIDDDLLARGMNVYGAEVVGGMNDIAAIVKQKDVGLIILADHRMTLAEYRNFHEAATKTSVQVFAVPDIFGWLNKLSNRPTENEPVHNENAIDCPACLGSYGFLADSQEANSEQVSGPAGQVA